MKHSFFILLTLLVLFSQACSVHETVPVSLSEKIDAEDFEARLFGL